MSHRRPSDPSGRVDQAAIGQIRRLLLFLVTMAVVACAPDAPKFRSADISGASFARDFELRDSDGNVRRLADFRGKLVVLFFGFTHCPDVCPTAMATLADAVLKLRSDGRYVQGIFITIDPERDTPDLLSRYVMAFHPTFLGLSGDAVATERVAKEFKVAYQKVPGNETGSYSMDHSAGMFVFDPKGNVRLYVRHGQDSDGLAHDLRELLCESSADLPELRGCSWRRRAGSST